MAFSIFFILLFLILSWSFKKEIFFQIFSFTFSHSYFAFVQNCLSFTFVLFHFLSSFFSFFSLFFLVYFLCFSLHFILFFNLFFTSDNFFLLWLIFLNISICLTPIFFNFSEKYNILFFLLLSLMLHPFGIFGLFLFLYAYFSLSFLFIHISLGFSFVK